MSPAAQAFSLPQLLAQRRQSGEEYLQFLKIPSLRLGIYALAAGADDTQTPHQEDEVYYILRGRALLRVESEDYPVEPGSLIFVAAHAEHRFHSIQEPLEILVFFSATPK